MLGVAMDCLFLTCWEGRLMGNTSLWLAILGQTSIDDISMIVNDDINSFIMAMSELQELD